MRLALVESGPSVRVGVKRGRSLTKIHSSLIFMTVCFLPAAMKGAIVACLLLLAAGRSLPLNLPLIA